MKLTLLLLTILGINSTIYSQMDPYGQTIIGTGTEQLPSEVAMSDDGAVMIVGSDRNATNGTNCGEVRVFNYDGVDWLQKGATMNGSNSGNLLGLDVQISGDGNTIAIGSNIPTPNGFGGGTVTIHEWNGSSWEIKGDTLFGENAHDFAHKIALSNDGNVIAIGARQNATNGAYSGQVRIFEWSGTSWIQKGSSLLGDVTNEMFGWELVMANNGNTLAVANPFNAIDQSSPGRVRVFNWSGSNWTQQGSDLFGLDAGDNLGFSLGFSSDGSRLVVGAPRGDYMGTTNGYAMVYEWTGADWAVLGDTIAGLTFGGETGSAVDISSDGSRIAVSSYASSDNGFLQSGRVDFYKWSGNSWDTEFQGLQGVSEVDHFGQRFKLNATGTRVAIGAPKIGTPGYVSTFEISTIGAVELDLSNISVYPNPVINDKLTIEGPEVIQSVLVLNSYGQLVHECQPNVEKHLIQTDGLPNGVYFLHIETTNGVYNRRVLL